MNTLVVKPLNTLNFSDSRVFKGSMSNVGVEHIKNNSAGQHMLPCFVTLRRHTMQYPFPEPLKVAHPIGISFYHLDAVVAPFGICVAQSCPKYV